MANHSNEGFFNPAYHDSETLEIDKRSSSRNHHSNPYAGDNSAWWGERAESRDEAVREAPWSGWQEESWTGRESIHMGHMTTPPGSFSRQHNLSHSTFEIDPDSRYDQSLPVRPPSSVSGNMTMRWRGITMKRMSMFPNADPAQLAITENAIRSEMENEEQNLVKGLVALSTGEQIRAIRDLPMSFEEKKNIRNQVLVFKTFKKSQHFTCFADCSENLSLSLRRCGYSIRSARQTLELWQGIMKEIGGKFGSSVLTYFVFLKWLLMFNIFSFLVNFGFITIPLLVDDHSPHIPPNVNFRGLELLTGAGYFNYTVMYYGIYNTTAMVGYNMQLAYFFTTSLYMVLCGIVLIFSMTSSFKKNYVLSDPTSNSAWQLLCSWDFTVTNERAVRQRKNNLRVQLKESLSEKAQGEMLTVSEKLKHYGVYFGSWFLSTSLAVGCGASIFYLCKYEEKQVTDDTSWSLLQEAETLLVPFVVSLMNLVIPLIFSLFNQFEHYSNQRKQIYALVARNVFLRMSILGVLCYYWISIVPLKFSCWESVVGQALYRLVVFDFLFQMLGSFFGEFLRNVIGTKLYPSLGVPEFDVARNVLELIYAQTLAWIGIYFSPLLPVMQILKFFTLFYLKKVSLTHNCQPPRRSGRAAQMQTIFIFLLFFPFFVGALSVVAYTAWSLIPSKHCGPFQGFNNTFGVVGDWIDDLEQTSGPHWVVWIYQNVIRSEIFYFLITLIILVVIYIFWQLTKGRKELIGILKQQIINEGKDKSFLLDKLQNLQKCHPKRNPKYRKQKGLTNRHSDDRASRNQSNSNAMFQALLARQQVEEDEGIHSTGGASVLSDVSTSSALRQAMLARQKAERQNEDLYHKTDDHTSSFNPLAQAMAARQRAEDEETDNYSSATDFYENPSNRSSAVMQAMQARLRAEEDKEDESYDQPSPVSDVMIQVMQARQRAEEEDRIQWVPAPPQNPAPSSSSALIQAMLARQQAQNEYDDGY